MERLTRADVISMLHRINELTDRVLLLEGSLESLKKPVKRAPARKKA